MSAQPMMIAFTFGSARGSEGFRCRAATSSPLLYCLDVASDRFDSHDYGALLLTLDLCAAEFAFYGCDSQIASH